MQIDSGLLHGLRVIELCWVWAGPLSGQLFGDLGAQVIKVEWYDRFDIYRLRGVERLKGKVPEEERREMSHSFHSLNRNKHGITLNIKDPEHRKALLEVVKESDLIIENFTQGTLERNGLGFESLREVNEELVVLSLSGFGASSRLSAMRAYGLILSGLSGVEHEIRDPDSKEFLGSPTFVISDPNAAVYGLLAGVNACYDARRSGKGRHITVSQLEAAGHLLDASDERLAELAEELGVKFAVATTPTETLRTADGFVVAGAVQQEGEEVAFVDDESRRRIRELSSEAAIELLAERELHAVAVVSDTAETGAGATVAGTLIPSEHPATGYEEIVAAPWWVDGARPALRKPAPILGESNRFVLERIGGIPSDESQRLVSGWDR